VFRVEVQVLKESCSAPGEKEERERGEKRILLPLGLVPGIFFNSFFLETLTPGLGISDWDFLLGDPLHACLICRRADRFLRPIRTCVCACMCMCVRVCSLCVNV
jgi:hypothetical protein